VCISWTIKCLILLMHGATVMFIEKYLAKFINKSKYPTKQHRDIKSHSSPVQSVAKKFLWKKYG